MKAILNHEIIDLEDFKLTQTNRGLLYGDGLFETIAYINNRPRFLSDHIMRLRNGAALLRIEWPDQFNLGTIEEHISALAKANNIMNVAIIRIHLWRESEGTFMPTKNDGFFLLTMKHNDFKKLSVIITAGFANECRNMFSKWSSVKSMSSLNYVMAGIEKKERELDEVIILDQEGYVSEALSSNIFWRKENTYFTPPLSTGCVEGVMKAWLDSALQNEGYQVLERKARKDEFLDADHIFTTNAAGIAHIKSIENTEFSIDETAQRLIESIS